MPLSLQEKMLGILLNPNSEVAKEKFEIVIRAAPPPFRIFAGRIPRRRRWRNAFGLSLEYCIKLIALHFQFHLAVFVYFWEFDDEESVLFAMLSYPHKGFAL